MPANTCVIDTLIEYIEKSPVLPGEQHVVPEARFQRDVPEARFQRDVPEGSDFYIARAPADPSELTILHFEHDGIRYYCAIYPLCPDIGERH